MLRKVKRGVLIWRRVRGLKIFDEGGLWDW